MDTIYSKVIWGELGYTPNTFKIHEAEEGVIDKMIIDWVKTAEFEKVEEILFGYLSPLSSVTYESYYDGPFYGINGSDKEKKEQIHATDNEGDFRCDILSHHSEIFPAIFHIAAKTNLGADDLRFMADLLEAYQKREPKGKTHGWDHNIEQGTEI